MIRVWSNQGQGHAWSLLAFADLSIMTVHLEGPGGSCHDRFLTQEVPQMPSNQGIALAAVPRLSTVPPATISLPKSSGVSTLPGENPEAYEELLDLWKENLAQGCL